MTSVSIDELIRKFYMAVRDNKHPDQYNNIHQMIFSRLSNNTLDPVTKMDFVQWLHLVHKNGLYPSVVDILLSRNLTYLCYGFQSNQNYHFEMAMTRISVNPLIFSIMSTAEQIKEVKKTPIEYLTLNRTISRFNLTLNQIITTIPAESFYTIFDVPLLSNTHPWIKRVNFDIFVAIAKHALYCGKQRQLHQYLHDMRTVARIEELSTCWQMHKAEHPTVTASFIDVLRAIRIDQIYPDAIRFFQRPFDQRRRY